MQLSHADVKGWFHSTELSFSMRAARFLWERPVAQALQVVSGAGRELRQRGRAGVIDRAEEAVLRPPALLVRDGPDVKDIAVHA